jgi:hypothetical protein
MAWLRQAVQAHSSSPDTSFFSWSCNRDIFKLILIELKEIWPRAAIPIKTDKKCLNQMISLHANWKIVYKNSIEERLSLQCRLQVE